MQDKIFKSFACCLIGGILVYAGFKIMGQHPNASTLIIAVGGCAIVEVINIWSPGKGEDN